MHCCDVMAETADSLDELQGSSVWRTSIVLFDPDGLAICSEQDQITAVNGHSDPDTQIISRRIGRRHFTTRSQCAFNSSRKDSARAGLSRAM